MCVVPCTALRLQCMYAVLIVRPRPPTPVPPAPPVSTWLFSWIRRLWSRMWYISSTLTAVTRYVSRRDDRPGGGRGGRYRRGACSLHWNMGLTKRYRGVCFEVSLLWYLLFRSTWYTNEKLRRLSVLLATGTISSAVLQIPGRDRRLLW